MKVTDIEMARRLVEEWRSAPVPVQLRNLRLARENLELDQMYYEQKGNERGADRCEACLRLLLAREEELGSPPPRS